MPNRKSLALPHEYFLTRVDLQHLFCVLYKFMAKIAMSSPAHVVFIIDNKPAHSKPTTGKEYTFTIPLLDS
jgi:hypothetical protein